MNRILRSITSTGKSSKTSASNEGSSQGRSLDDIINETGFGHIEFFDDAHRRKFVNMLDRDMSPTRFIDHDALDLLGLKGGVRDMLQNSGCPGLYTMCEHSYKCITLEFLSSFYYDENQSVIWFRLFSEWHPSTLEEFGDMIGCRSVGQVEPDGPRCSSAALWTLLTGLPKGGQGWRFRAHYIQHPIIRIWTRILGNVYFARPEPNNMKAQETHILFSYLNPDGGTPFLANVAHHVARHLQLVADGVISHIMMGGLVTHIARHIYEDNLDESQLMKVPANDDGSPFTLDIPNMIQMHWIKAIDSWNWVWLLKRTHLLRLPEEGPERRIRPVIPSPRGHMDLNYYLLGRLTERSDGQTGRSTRYADRSPSPPNDRQPPSGINLIPYTGDYSGFQHIPFNMAPYNPPGFENVPDTFAAYPPFQPPPVWNQQARDAMILGLCNQMQQANLHNALAAHNICQYIDQNGGFPQGTVHPPFYNPNVSDDDDDSPPSSLSPTF